MISPLFDGGKIVATPAALDVLDQAGISYASLLDRHFAGDWGNLVDEDKEENSFSIKNGFRILSSYDTTAGTLWIITEADRSTTTLLRPEDY